MRRRLVLIFPFYSDGGGFNKDSIKDLKDQPVFMEFFTELEKELNDYMKDPKEEKLELVNKLLVNKTRKQTIKFKEKGYYDSHKRVYGEPLTKQINEIIRLIAEKKMESEEERCIHAIDTMVSKPISPKERNEILTQGVVETIEKFNGAQSLECYVLMDREHVKDILINSSMLNELIFNKLRLTCVKHHINQYNNRILEYSN